MKRDIATALKGITARPQETRPCVGVQNCQEKTSSSIQRGIAQEASSHCVMQKVRDMSLKLTRYSANLRSGGFSLLEVLIALAILGVSVVSVFQLFSITLRSTKKAEDYTRALLYAQSLLDEAYSAGNPMDSPVTISFGKGYQGSRQVVLKAVSDDGAIKLYEISASVSWQPAGSLRIAALRAVYDPEK
ncbi:MAG: hypothetical protein C0402_01115 [Thermodesulfovibrio sp.]|nr:hypothetical protein [Thermodesulfovibrio sp.]